MLTEIRNVIVRVGDEGEGDQKLSCGRYADGKSAMRTQSGRCGRKTGEADGMRTQFVRRTVRIEVVGTIGFCLAR